MPDITPRLAWQDFCLLGPTVVTASSTNPAFPRRWMKDQQPGMRWRSVVGWNIVAGFNDKIDITEGGTGDAIATLTAGNYATGALMAVQVATAINAAATDNTWTCTYSTSTYKFTIGHDNVQTGGLEWDGGASAATSAGECLGYDTSADDTGATSYVGDDATYKSREYIQFDFAAAKSVKCFGLEGTNLPSDATITIWADSTTTFTPDFTDTIPQGTDTDLWFEWISVQTYRYWRIILDDISNDDGYTEIGVPWISSYTEPGRSVEQRYQEPRQELSRVAVADQGSHYVDIKPTRKGYNVQFRSLSASDRDALELFADFAVTGRNFFWGYDPLNDAVDKTKYMSLLSPMTIAESPYARFDIALKMGGVL